MTRPPQGLKWTLMPKESLAQTFPSSIYFLTLLPSSPKRIRSVSRKMRLKNLNREHRERSREIMQVGLRVLFLTLC